MQQQLQWQTWEWQTPQGFLLKGVHTPPSGKPVLYFTHGNSYCGLVYLPLWERLSAHFDIFLHDAQGHGDSEEGGRFVGWSTCASYLDHVWQAHKERFGDVPVIGMGHSFGAVLTLIAATRHPQLFSHVVALDPILLPPRLSCLVDILQTLHLYPRNPYAKRAKKRRMTWASIDSARTNLMGRGMFHGWKSQALEAYLHHAMEQKEEGLVLKCPPRIEAAIFGSYMPQVWRKLSKLTTPTLAVFGHQSYPFLKESEKKIGNLACAQTSYVSGGHCFMLEHPEQTAALVQKQLAEFLEESLEISEV